jgi:hypothetical protein
MPFHPLRLLVLSRVPDSQKALNTNTIGLASSHITALTKRSTHPKAFMEAADQTIPLGEQPIYVPASL